eukprot:gene2590-3975_t
MAGGGGGGGAAGDPEGFALPAAPTVESLREDLALLEGPPSAAAMLAQAEQLRGDAGTAAGVAMIEKALWWRGRDRGVVARRVLLPGSAADAVRATRAALLLHNLASVLPEPPEVVGTFLTVPVAVEGAPGGALSTALHAIGARAGGDGNLVAEGHVSLAQRPDVVRKVVRPAPRGPWAIVAVGHGLRMHQLAAADQGGGAESFEGRPAGLRALRALLLGEEVREVLVRSGAAGVAYFTVARGGTPAPAKAAELLRVEEAKAAKAQVDPDAAGFLDAPDALEGVELEQRAARVGGTLPAAGRAGLGGGGGAPPLPGGTWHPAALAGAWGGPAAQQGGAGGQLLGAGGGGVSRELDELLRRQELERREREERERKNWSVSDEEREQALGRERARRDPKRKANADCGSLAAPQWFDGAEALIADPQGTLSYLGTLLRHYADLTRGGDVREVRDALRGRSGDEVRVHLVHGFARRAAHETVRSLRDLARLGDAVQGMAPQLAEAWAQHGVEMGLLTSTALGEAYARQGSGFLRGLAEARAHGTFPPQRGAGAARRDPFPDDSGDDGGGRQRGRLNPQRRKAERARRNGDGHRSPPRQQRRPRSPSPPRALLPPPQQRWDGAAPRAGFSGFGGFGGAGAPAPRGGPRR